MHNYFRVPFPSWDENRGKCKSMQNHVLHEKWNTIDISSTEMECENGTAFKLAN